MVLPNCPECGFKIENGQNFLDHLKNYHKKSGYDILNFMINSKMAELTIYHISPKGEVWYRTHKAELDEKYYDKVIAINYEGEDCKIVGVGDDISSAYAEAVRNTGNHTVSYLRRVGYLDRI